MLVGIFFLGRYNGCNASARAESVPAGRFALSARAETFPAVRFILSAWAESFPVSRFTYSARAECLPATRRSPSARADGIRTFYLTLFDMGKTLAGNGHHAVL